MNLVFEKCLTYILISTHLYEQKFKMIFIPSATFSIYK